MYLPWDLVWIFRNEVKSNNVFLWVYNGNNKINIYNFNDI